MASEVEFWRQDPATKAEGIAREVERLSRQARAAGLSVTAYILGLAVEEARKEAGTEDREGQHDSSWRPPSHYKGDANQTGRHTRPPGVAAQGPPCSVGDNATLVRDRRLGIRRVSRVLLDAADEIERGMERLVVLGIRRDIGLRAGLLVASGLEVAAQRS